MSRRAQKNIGVIGLGIIGRRVADCLRRRGFHVFVWNRTPRPFPNFVGSPAEIAELCDFIQIFVSNDEALLHVIQQMKPSLKAHHVVMAHSTVAPSTVREAAEIVKRRGAQLLDAPFTGSKGAAEKGEIVYYIAGDDAAYRRARPVLDASSKEIIEIGEVGQAMTIKVATNMITAATAQIAAEALALVDHAGIPLEKFATAMKSNGSNSGTLAMKLPKMMSGDFETQFSVKHMLKDVEIAARLARGYGLRLGVTELAREALIEEAQRGGADDDYSAVVRSYFPQVSAMEEAIQPDLPEQPEAEAKAEVAVAAEAEAERITEAEHDPNLEAETARSEEVSRNGSDEMGDAVESRIPSEEVGREAKVEEGSEPEREQEAAPVEAKTEVGREQESEPLDAEREEAIETKREAAIEVEPEPVQEEEPVHGDEEEEIVESAKPTETEPAEPVAVAAAAKKEEEEEAAPRGFFSRFFGRGTDY